MTESFIEDRGPQLEAITYAMLVLATVAVALRFWARYVALKAGLWWDDWFSLAALVRSVLFHGYWYLFSITNCSFSSGLAVD